MYTYVIHVQEEPSIKFVITCNILSYLDKYWVVSIISLCAFMDYPHQQTNSRDEKCNAVIYTHFVPTCSRLMQSIRGANSVTYLTHAFGYGGDAR